MPASNIWELIGLLLVTGLFLAAFGHYYNQFVIWLQDELKIEGADALIVAGGCLFTVLAAYPLVEWTITNSPYPSNITALFILLVVIGCFAASGTPMLLGALQRLAALRLTLLRYQSLKNDQPTTPPAKQ
jgi:uncharacterized membrane protein